MVFGDVGGYWLAPLRTLVFSACFFGCRSFSTDFDALDFGKVVASPLGESVRKVRMQSVVALD